jgi:CheY-like chemotaxis protein
MVRVFPKSHYVCKNNLHLPKGQHELKKVKCSCGVSEEHIVVNKRAPSLRKHVLIVDDEPAVRRTVRGALESSGIVCAESENGAEALAWLEENPVDLVLADYNMPIMSGLTLLEQVNRTLNGRTPRIILLSGVINEIHKRKAMGLGAYAIIDKPCNFRELVEKVNEALDF